MHVTALIFVHQSDIAAGTSELCHVNERVVFATYIRTEDIHKNLSDVTQ